MEYGKGQTFGFSHINLYTLMVDCDGNCDIKAFMAQLQAHSLL